MQHIPMYSPAQRGWKQKVAQPFSDLDYNSLKRETPKDLNGRVSAKLQNKNTKGRFLRDFPLGEFDSVAPIYQSPSSLRETAFSKRLHHEEWALVGPPVDAPKPPRRGKCGKRVGKSVEITHTHTEREREEEKKRSTLQQHRRGATKASAANKNRPFLDKL